jgi:hypothetical protein
VEKKQWEYTEQQSAFRRLELSEKYVVEAKD